MGLCKAKFEYISRTNHVKSPDAWVLHAGGVFYASTNVIKTSHKLRSGDTMEVEIDLELREARFKFNGKLFQSVKNIPRKVRGLVCFGGHDQRIKLQSRRLKQNISGNDTAGDRKPSLKSVSTFPSVKGSRSVVLILISVIRSVLDPSNPKGSNTTAAINTTEKVSPQIDFVAVVAATQMLNLLVLRNSGNAHTDINATGHPDLKKAIRVLACKLLDSEVVSKNKNVRDVVLNLFTTIFEQIFVPKQQLDFIINLMKRQRTSNLTSTESGLLTRLITQLLNPTFTATILRHSPSIPAFFECLLELWCRTRVSTDATRADVESKSTETTPLSMAVLRVYHTLIAKMSMKVRFMEAFTVHPFDDNSLWLTFSKIFDLSVEELTQLCKSGTASKIKAKEKTDKIACLGNCSGMLLPLLMASLCNLFDKCRFLNEDSVCVQVLTPRIPQLLAVIKRTFRQFSGASESWPELSDHIINHSAASFEDTDACPNQVRVNSSMPSLSFWLFNVHNLTVTFAARFSHLLFHFNICTHDESWLRKVLHKAILQQPKCSLETLRNEVKFFKSLLKPQQNAASEAIFRLATNQSSAKIASKRISSSVENVAIPAPSESVTAQQQRILFETLEKSTHGRDELSSTTVPLAEKSGKAAVNHAIKAIFLSTLYHAGLYENLVEWLKGLPASDVAKRKLPNCMISAWNKIQSMRAVMLADDTTTITIDEEDFGYWGSHHSTVSLTEDNAIASKTEGSPDYSGAISANGIHEGETSWNIRLLDASEQIYIGVGYGDTPCDQGLQRAELRNRVWYYRNRGQLRCGDKTIEDTSIVCKAGDLLTVRLDLERKIVTFSKNEDTLIGTIPMDEMVIEPSEAVKLHAIAILDGVGDAVKMETNGFRASTQTHRPSLEVVSGTIDHVRLKDGDNFQVNNLLRPESMQASFLFGEEKR